MEDIADATSPPIASIRKEVLRDATPEGFRNIFDGLAAGAQEDAQSMAVVVAMKGCGSVMDTTSLHSRALEQLVELQANVLVWDGEWLDAGSFTSIIAKFLAHHPCGRAVVFHRADCDLNGFASSWADHAAQIAVALVELPAVEEAMGELHALGVAEEHLHGAALGWVSLRTSCSIEVLAIGGLYTNRHSAFVSAARAVQSGVEEP